MSVMQYISTRGSAPTLDFRAATLAGLAALSGPRHGGATAALRGLLAEAAEIGPAAIKLGQTLATRPDLVGEEAATNLLLLQDSLPPVPFADALSELCAYLDGLEDAGTLPFEQLIQLKAYALIGWKDWRAGFAVLEV